MNDNALSSSQKIPRVHLAQDPKSDPMRVVVVEDKDRNTPSIGCLVLFSFRYTHRFRRRFRRINRQYRASSRNF